MLRMWIGLVVLVCASPAFAQAPPPPPPVAADASLALWSPELALRPPTLPSGMAELHGSLPIFTFAGAGDSLILAGVGGAFGVSDQLEIGGDYAFEASPDADAAGVLAGHVLFRLQHNDQMSAALGGAVLYSHAEDGLVFGAGLAFRYRLNKQLSLFSSSSGMPLCGSCLQLLGPVTGQLVIAKPTNGDTVVLLNLPVGVGFQATPELYLFAETSIATILLSPETDSILEFSDYIGLHVGGWFAVNKDLELGAGFADELEHASDFYLIELRARIFLR